MATVLVMGLAVMTLCTARVTARGTYEGIDEFLFWDGIHPTESGHAILAEEVRLALGL